MPMDYPQYRHTISEAQRHASLWRLLFGLVTVVAICMAWIVGLLALAHMIIPGGVFAQGMNLDAADTPATATLFLFFIAGLGVGTWAAARFWQKRGLRSLIGRGSRALRHFVQAALMTFAMAALVVLVTSPASPPIVPNMNVNLWLLWLPIGLVAVALQTGAEELLFRGYLQSQLAARFANPVIWLFGPSILFGFAHFAPGVPLNAALVYVVFAALFGLMAADLTARTGTIGAAWGFHFANNSMAILLISTQGSLSGLGLYRSGDIVNVLSMSPVVLFELVALAVAWMLIRRIVSV